MKDFYYDCIERYKKAKEIIDFYKKDIERLKMEIEENKVFFQKIFGFSLDDCVDKSYSNYEKEWGNSEK